MGMLNTPFYDFTNHVEYYRNMTLNVIVTLSTTQRKAFWKCDILSDI